MRRASRGLTCGRQVDRPVCLAGNLLPANVAHSERSGCSCSAAALGVRGAMIYCEGHSQRERYSIRSVFALQADILQSERTDSHKHQLMPEEKWLVMTVVWNDGWRSRWVHYQVASKNCAPPLTRNYCIPSFLNCTQLVSGDGIPEIQMVASLSRIRDLSLIPLVDMGNAFKKFVSASAHEIGRHVFGVQV